MSFRHDKNSDNNDQLTFHDNGQWTGLPFSSRMTKMAVLIVVGVPGGTSFLQENCLFMLEQAKLNRLQYLSLKIVITSLRYGLEKEGEFVVSISNMGEKSRRKSDTCFRVIDG